MTQIKKDLLKKLQENIGYQFKDQSLLTLAMTHKSSGTPNNERLEFLGDSLLNTIVAEALFTRFDDVPEGAMTTARAKLVKARTLADLGFKMEFDQIVVLGMGEKKTENPVKHSIVGDSVEAVIGAMYLDSDFITCKEIVLDWYKDLLDTVTVAPESKDPKTLLQEIMQSMHLPLPKYEVIALDGPGHKQFFTVECQVELNAARAKGQGYSRRAAEQEAAVNILREFNHSNPANTK